MGSISERLAKIITELETATARRREIQAARQKLECAVIVDEVELNREVGHALSLGAEEQQLSARVTELTYKARMLGNALLPVRRLERDANRQVALDEVRTLETALAQAEDLTASRRAEVHNAETAEIEARTALERAANRHADLMLKQAKQMRISARTASPFRPPAGVLVRFGDWFDLITEAQATSAAELHVSFNEHTFGVALISATTQEGSLVPELRHWRPRA